jgi:hypothetical protein
MKRTFDVAMDDETDQLHEILEDLVRQRRWEDLDRPSPVPVPPEWKPELNIETLKDLSPGVQVRRERIMNL